MPDLIPEARAEREDLAAFLATLTPEEWDAPSLCTGWRVRDVVAHMVSYEDLGVLGVLDVLARGRFRFGQINDIALAPFLAWPPDELLARFRRYVQPRGATTFLGGRVALCDATIHHQDVRRALGKPREIPAARLRTVLAFAVGAPPLRAKARIAGLRLVADDLDWTHGEGPEVRGPGEAVLMAVAGRPAALPDLEGPGVAQLTRRTS